MRCLMSKSLFRGIPADGKRGRTLLSKKVLIYHCRVALYKCVKMIYVCFPKAFNVFSRKCMRLRGWGVILDGLVSTSHRNLGQPSFYIYNLHTPQFDQCVVARILLGTSFSAAEELY